MQYGKRSRKGSRLFALVAMFLIVTMAAGQPLSEMRVYAAEGPVVEQPADTSGGQPDETAVNTAEPAPQENPASAPLDAQPAGGEDVPPQDVQPAGGEDVQPQDTQPAGGEGAQTQDVQPEGGEGAQTQDTQPAGGDTPVPEAPAGDGAAAEDGNGAAAPGTDPAAEETAENENAAGDDAQDPKEPEKSSEENSDEAESYIVEFSYNGLTYVMQGGSSVKLSEILAAVGLADGVENVTVSNETLFSASNESGEWEITAHQAFFSAEWMKVTIGGTEYEITATGKKPEDAAAKDPEAEGPSAAVEVRGFSKTKNIVGDVFVNWVNHANPELQERSLLEYPLDPHDRAYYGDSPRVRLLEGGNPSNPNYLVYRDSYLLIPKEQSSQYTVTFSEDDSTAYVTPAIPAEELSGRTGVVFLAESVGYDNILVFGGEVSYDGDIAVIPLKKTEEITVNMLFSDGKLEVSPEDGMGQAKRRSFLKAKSGYTLPWENLSGTNWKGKITGFSAEWPTPGFGYNVWDLLFELTLTLSFDLDFDITTTGATKGRETATVAGISIPIEGLFTVDLDYNLQVEFSDIPIHVKGTLNTVFDYTLGTHGAQIREYKTPVEISELTVLNDDDYNKSFEFYIGSQLAISGKVLYINLDLGLFSVKLGPVLDLAQDSHGGCKFTAIHEKDLLKTDPPVEGNPDDRYIEIEEGRISDGGKLNFRDRNAAPDEIHTCTAEHEAGCLHLDSEEVQQNKISFTIDLWFDDWTFDISDSGENTIEEKEYYNSYTFNSGMKEGVCPHRFYKVPVNVWLDDEKTKPAPEGITVTVSDAVNVAACEEQFINATTDSNGKTLLFLPYKEEYKYTLIASGTIDGRSLTGSKRQRTYMKAGENEPVDIVLMPDEKTRVEANVIWNVDADGKDVPANSMVLVLQRREAGTDKPWEIAEDYELHNMSREIRKETGWRVEGWTVPKFGFESERAYLYEYRVRIQENHHIVDDPATAPFYGDLYRNVDSYDNAAGLTEPAHSTHYRFSYSENVTDDVTTTTITGTAIMNVSVKKIWNLADPADKAPFVYLALQQKPEFGWEDLGAAKGVPTDWVPILNPLSGRTTTLRKLIDKALLTTSDYIGEIENTPLTIGQVNGSSWILRYDVPKYRKGIQMQFEGCELDKDVIERLFQYEYDLNVMADVPSFGEYTSIPGLPADINDYEKSINVINTDPLVNGTLIGTVRWEMDHSGKDYLPDSVTLHIFKDGVEIPESPVTLQQANYSGLDTWIWTKKVQDYDPDAEYTVKEVLSNNNLEWVGVVSGLDVYNYRIWYDALQVEAQAVFEGEPAIENLHVSVRDKESEAEVWKFDLAKNQAWWDRDPNVKKSEAKDISQYKLDAPDVPGYVKVYGEPYAYTRPGWGNLFYNFTVYYVKQSNELNLHISKEWENTDDSTDYPAKVKITVKRDGDVIAENELSQDEETGEWSSFIVSQDKKGNPLSRLGEGNHKYVYTIEEEPVEGFTSKVRVTEDTGDDIYYTVTNTWAGQDYVNVQGVVSWERDEGKEYLRPETVKLSVVNAREEYVRTVEVPITFKENGNDEDNKKYTWEAKYLPGKDKDGSLLRYSVVESHVPGYAITYDKPIYDETTGKWSNFDETTRTWTCNLTNTLIGYFPLTIKKVIEGEAGDNDVYEFTVESKEQEDGTEREIPLPLNKDDLKISSGAEKKEVTADFLLDEDGLYLYSIKEKKGENENCTYDDTEKLVLIVRSSKRNPETGVLESSFESWVGKAEKDSASAGMTPIDAAEVSAGGQIDGYYEKGKTVEFVNVYSNITIEKKWNIDLQGNDRPDSIEVVVQAKKDGKWENVRLVELNEDNDWKASVSASGEIRVRELKPEEKGLFKDLVNRLKGMVTGALDNEYGEVISSIQGSDYYVNLPDSIKEPMNQGADKLKEELNATSGNLFDKLVEQVGLAALVNSGDRVVYDSDDEGKPDGAKTNEVTFNVGGSSANVSEGNQDAHETKYRVEYSEDGGTFKITNTAIVDIDVIKRWAAFGVDDNGLHISLDDEDKPDSAWVVLMFSADTDGIAGNETLGNLAEMAGFSLSDITGLSDYEIPVFSVAGDTPFLLEGGSNPISIISELALGIDLSILDSLIPVKMAIAKVDEESNWRKHYVVSKYAYGVPVEFKGAELSSEVIRQIIKYVSGGTINLSVSYNPFENYFSIPTKAVASIMGMKDPQELLDLSGLAGKMWEKAKSLTIDDLKNIGIDTVLDDTDLMANVINVKINWDTSEDQILTKDWVGDKEETRPERLTVYLKDELAEGQGEIPIVLEKANFKGKDTWEYDLSELDEQEDEDGDDEEEEKHEHSYKILREEYSYPKDSENYENSYALRIDQDELTLTNTWKDPEKVIISGKKIWEDDDDQDGIRPETVTFRLLSAVDGEEPVPVMVTVKEEAEDGTITEKEVELTAETSKEGKWKFTFPPQPKYKETAEEGENTGSGENGETGGKDGAERKEIAYSVEEVLTDVITADDDGEGKYKVSYAEPVKDEAGNLTCDVINTHTTRKLTVEKKWVDRDGNPTDEWKPESVRVVLQHKKGAETETPEPGNTTEVQDPQQTEEASGSDTDTWETVGEPVELNEENQWKAEFQAKGLTESTVGDWRIRELDPDGKVIFAEGDEDAPKDDSDKTDLNNEIVLNVVKDGKNNDVPYVVSYEVDDGAGEEPGETGGETGKTAGTKGNTVIINKLNGKQVTVEKSWDIDLEKKDHPDSIEAVIQEKKDDKWNTVALVELNGENSWKESRFLPAGRDGSEIEYRARELREETALEEAVKKAKAAVSSAVTGSYEDIIRQIQTEAGEYYSLLPDEIKTAAEQSSDQLKNELKTTTENLYDKLLEQIGIASSANRIVYDKDDSDKPKDGDKKTNTVTYFVKEEGSVIPGSEGSSETAGGQETGHNTTYRVSYGKEGDNCKIANKAILEIDVIKRWLGVGVDDEDMPDSAWVVLMFKVAEDARDKAQQIPGADQLPLDYDFPVFNWDLIGEDMPFLLEDGKDPLSIISELTIGVDLSIFSSVLPKMAIAKVTKDDDWRVHYTVSKYAMGGLPVEFKGAELGSEIIRQIIKYVTNLDIPVSYNPFDNYISIPTKAIRTILGMEDLEDLNKLPQAALDKLKGMTEEEWKALSPETALDDDHLMANVINIKIDWDTGEDPEPITGKKIWKDDTEENRPEWIKIHVKDEKKEIEGSPITLNKSDFSGQNEWEWTIEPGSGEEGEGGSEEALNPDDLTVTEEFPEDYQYKDHYTPETDGLDITNTWHEEEPETISISGRKIWKDDDNKDGIRPETITVKLLADGTEVKSVETSEEGGWKYRFDDLPKYKEAAEEGGAGTGENNGTDNTEAGGNSGTGDTGRQEIVYTIEEVKVDGYETETDGFNLINTHEPKTITIEGQKVWEDKENQDGKRPDSITIRLLADGKEAGVKKVTEADDWVWSFDGLPENTDGEAITYTITEDAVEDYTSSVEGDAENGFTVTNTYTPSKTQVNVIKVWSDKDNQDGIRPDSVTIKLLADGSPATDENGDPLTLVLSEENNWTGTFENLDVSKDGKEIAYTVEEETDGVITGTDGEETYSCRVSGDAKGGFTVTNRHTPQTITVEGKKTWDDSDNQDGKRPESIVIRLRADGEEVRNRTVTANADWAWRFDGLPQYADGKEIEYTISEDSIPEYTSEIDEFDVTNTYTPGKTQVDVTKVWKDEDDRDGIRPKSVTIRLLADEAPVTDENGDPVTLVLSEGNKWTGLFKDLDQKDQDGKEIVYTVEEEPNDVITGEDGEGTYASEVSGSMEKGFTVTNTHTSKTITIEGQKVWEDKEDQDGKRPDSITIRLLADGKEAGVKKVTEADGWVWSFEGLPEKADGKAITYTITEDVVEDYTSSVEGDAENGFTVTNTYTPGKTQVNVVKVWSDKDDQDGIRPTSVTVSLLAGGEETGKTLLLSEANNWSGSFTDLDAKQDGEPVSYTVEEKQTAVITGTDGRGTYGIEVTGDAEKGFKVRNTHTPEILTIGGTKVWNDAENQDKRPESITIRLKADGKDCVVRKVTAADDWKWSFEKLPKYDGEREIVYTLTEDAVPEYTTEISGNAQDGFTVTNTYDPGKTQVTVTKVWNDDNDHDKIRPDQVRVFLLANGEKTGKDVKLNEKNNWTYTFSGLKTSAEDGEPIRYTVEEESRKVTTGTDGEGTYAVNITGTAAKGFTVTNTHTPQKVRISVNKVWDDGEDQDGLRKPIKSITVTLLADGKPAKDAEENPVTLSKENGWKGEFTGLDKEKDGTLVEYTVEEKKTNVITGEDGAGTYAIAINGNTEKGFTITNTHTPETVSVEGEKTWDDKENQDGERPESITIRLLNDKNEKVASVKADAAGGWKWKFTDLPKYRNGSEIKYRVMEDAVDGYTAAYEKPVFDKQNNVWTCDVTNTHTPGKTQVSVVKVWKDDLDGTENADGIRPGSVKVTLLLKTGAPVLDEKNKPVTAVLSEKNGWSHTFAVDAKKDGEPITYMVEEEKTDVITGKDTMSTYAIAVTGDQKQGYTITNTHTPVRYTIIYDLDGGTYKGSPDDIIEIYPYGTKITIHEKPVKPGYEFQYWQGSTYQPGDKYTVTEDHKFTAVWEPVPTPTPTPTPTDGPTVTPVPGTPTSPPVKPIPGTPYGPGNTTSTLTGAKTGDNSHMIQWLIVLIAAAAALGGIGIYRKKRSAPDEK